MRQILAPHLDGPQSGLKAKDPHRERCGLLRDGSFVAESGSLRARRRRSIRSLFLQFEGRKDSEILQSQGHCLRTDFIALRQIAKRLIVTGMDIADVDEAILEVAA